MHKERVLFFVLHLDDVKAAASSSMEFYAFNDRMFCPTFEVNRSPHWIRTNKKTKSVEIHDSYRARPFTGLNSSPRDCSLGSFGDCIYVIGGSVLSSDLIASLYAVRTESDMAEIVKDNPQIGQQITFKDITIVDNDSNRVKLFELPKFINSSFDNKHGIFNFGELDDDSNDSSTYWKRCPSLSGSRSRGQLLHLGGKLYVVGGCGYDSKVTSLIEVFDHDRWTPLVIEPHLDISPSFLVSAAIEDSNVILLGSNDWFYLIDVGDGKGVAKWKKGPSCPYDLILTCQGRPGCVVGDRILWYDRVECYIRGFQLSSNRYFSVALRTNVMLPGSLENDNFARLVDLGDGRLCFIYGGPEWYSSIDDQGVEHLFSDYRCVTFKIDYQDKLEDGPVKPYPGCKLKSRVLSRRKCYASSEAHLGAAFAMDVKFPHKNIWLGKEVGRHFGKEKLVLPASGSGNLCTKFSLAEIISATQDFSEELVIGQGGFGKVYRGLLNDGSTVAIERIGTKFHHLTNFSREVETLSELQHDHVIRLKGYCKGSAEMAIVYEYMPKGSLDGHLYNQDCLTWEQRLNICIGVARGLDFLHRVVEPRIVHGNIKCENILLDDHFVPKISSLTLPQLDDDFSTSNFPGTLAYLDPQYLSTCILTTKSDVYSFGVVLLVVLTGIEPWRKVGNDQYHSSAWAMKCIREKKIDQIIHPCLKGQIQSKGLKQFSKIAVQCLHIQSKYRPTMVEVVSGLELALQYT